MVYADDKHPPPNVHTGWPAVDIPGRLAAAGTHSAAVVATVRAALGYESVRCAAAETGVAAGLEMEPKSLL